MKATERRPPATWGDGETSVTTGAGAGPCHEKLALHAQRRRVVLRPDEATGSDA